jgi:hypothetical protein
MIEYWVETRHGAYSVADRSAGLRQARRAGRCLVTYHRVRPCTDAPEGLQFIRTERWTTDGRVIVTAGAPL